MKRQKASTKMTNIVHEGWMTKSPPEKKLNRSTPFKIFRAQWKKRYFVLRKPSGSLPDQYELHYFKDDRCNSKKGSIDLDQCEKIIESLDSDQFQYLFAIKTVCRNKVRTYYLAADSEQEMSTWVQWLCHVCGLKQEEQPTDIPEPRPSHLASQNPNFTSANGVSTSPPHHLPQQHPRQSSSSSHPSHQLSVTSGPSSSSSLGGTTVQPGSTSSSSTTGHAVSASPPVPAAPTGVSQPGSTVQRTGSDNSLSYIYLGACTTGQPQERKGSSESVPDFAAPPIPPAKRNQDGSHMDSCDDVFVTPSDLYQHPPAPVEVPSRSTVTSDVYKVPPVRSGRPSRHTIDTDEEDQRNECYDVPPPRRDSPPSRRTSYRKDSSNSSSRPVTGGPSECYDYPPPRLDSTTSSDGGDLPPERPPRPSYMQSPYQNLPPAGKSEGSGMGGLDLNTVLAPPRAHKTSVKIDYDIPPSHHRSVSTHPLNTVTPPPPKPIKSTDNPPHTYLNTQGRPNSADMVLSGKDRSDEEPSPTPPAIPPPRYGSLGEPLESGRSVSPHQLLYQSPPPSSASSSASSNAMVPPGRPPARAPPKPPTASPNASENRKGQGQIEDGGSIFSTARTRSFKKQHNINNNVKLPSKANTLPMNTSVPRATLASRTRDISTSEDEEEATHHSISLLNFVPSPSDTDGELKYIDLALPDAGQDAPRASHSHGHTHSHGHHSDRSKDSATEYREIDFVKTQALSDAKKDKDKERKSDDHN